jgi:hypothetical protein
LLAAGLVLILVLDLGAGIRAFAGLIWIAAGHDELQCLQTGFSGLRAIRLTSDGSIAVLNSDHQWLPGECQSGCIVLQNLAWLRFRTADGCQYVELLRGDSRESHSWRRFQVIWRHIGAGR